MFDTLEEIREQLLAGEDALAEFKEVRLGDRSVASPNSEDFAGEVAAFANAEGGVLFLGVADGGVVRGIPDAALAVVEGWVINVESLHVHRTAGGGDHPLARAASQHARPGNR